jgi:C4-dicarboxylate transporter DctQ subunit
MTQTTETPAPKPSRLRRIDEATRCLEHMIAGGLLIVAVVVILVDILLRAAFSYALPWAGEATRYAIIWLVFVAGGIGARDGAHISIDFLAEIVPRRLAIHIARIAALLSAFTCALLAWFGFDLTLQMRTFGQTSPSLEWPMWIIYMSVPIGCALMSVRFLQSVFDVAARDDARGKVALSAA